MRYRFLPLMLIVFLAVGLLAACGSSGTASPTSTATATVTIVVTATPTAAADPTATADADGSPFVLVVATAAAQTNRPTPQRPASKEPTPTPGKSSFDANGDGFYTFDELQEAVAALIPKYTWPPHYHVTAVLIMAPFAKNPTIRKTARWQVNYEYTLVGGYHKCGWERAWLDAFKVGDQQVMQAATQQLRDVAPKNIAFADPSMQRLLKDIGDAAALGDPAPIQNDVDHNCKIQFITPTPAT